MPRRSDPRTLRDRAFLLSSIAALASVACGGSTEPKLDDTRPANLVVITEPARSGVVDTEDGPFVVKVVSKSGRGVPGVPVTFSADVKDWLMFSPNAVTTDSSGIASTTVTLGTVTGERTAFVDARGVPQVALPITVKPGPPYSYRLNATSLRLYGVGDSTALLAESTDSYGNNTGLPVGFQISDPSLISITPPTTPGGAALVKALKAGGPAQINFTGGNTPSAIPVTVFQSQRNACSGVSAPQVVPLGVPTIAADSVLCLEQSGGAEYALIVYNQSTDGSTAAGTQVTAYNVVPDLVTARIPTGGPSLSRAATLSGMSTAPRRDLRFHERLLTRSRSLRRLFAPARAARSLARPGSVGRIRGPSYALSGTAPSVPAVDSLLALNVADDPCTIADTRTFRVEAVGTHAIVLADTANPAGGFTRADYQRFAARFDTLVYPLDVDAFGASSDIDGNDHVAILFTRAVNELTPANASSYIGGFFHPRDLFPRTQSGSFGVCPTSNEGEMFYMMVPDPSGTVNGNTFRLGYVDTLTTGILAHEFQHLINAGRRMYVNTTATDFEETWLNEGLSHEAEELLYFRESGYQPRGQLYTQSIYQSQAQFSTWVADESSNFVRFFLYLSDPANHSPLDANDDLETRGATWAFLRFAVDAINWDKVISLDLDIWQRFGNSTTTGAGTLAFAFQTDPKPLLRDFAVANTTGYLRTWSYADIYTKAFVAKAYPLPFGRLQEATAIPVAARGSSASYYNFAVPPGAQTLLRFGSSQAPADPNFVFIVTRLR
jgi:hypothetical protein